MTLVIVERAFEAPQQYAELQAREDEVQFCFTTHRVTRLQSFLSADRRLMQCLYDAPDAEAVRTTQHAAELPVERVWPATCVVERWQPVPAGYALVVAQRDLPPGQTLEAVAQSAARPSGCNNRLRIKHLAAYLSLDCRRMCCIYSTPDVESVRMANREDGLPIDRAWAAQRIVVADYASR